MKSSSRIVIAQTAHMTLGVDAASRLGALVYVFVCVCVWWGGVCVYVCVGVWVCVCGRVVVMCLLEG